MGPTCVNLSIFGSNMRWDQRSQLPEHNFSQYLIRSQNVAPLYTNIDIHENFPQNPQICSPCKCQESAEKATCKPFPPKSIIYSWPLVKCVEASGPRLASQKSGAYYFFYSFLVGKKERILSKKFLFFDNTGFTAALWGLSLTCALMTTEFGQLMALLRIYCHNLISRLELFLGPLE